MDLQSVNGDGNSLASRRSRPGVLLLTADDRRLLERWIRARTTPQRVVLRSRIVLTVAEGISSREAARRLGVSRHTVDLWRARFLEGGCAALARDKAGRGRKRRGQAICR
jgi:DNA-directed RNA polymerase specialized sigma24 family protein